ncbi:hypothetical protein EV702DRAFT_1202394 [Suillus placidus]|uniref:Uncharacterized protein n=1 Tax=Suillus placidus TaxID=48579 RepID=A0A9P6ZKS6_9AGAM|nr:hypothetical protein EV702DRAFT_1202394 [Suillus placidus]
MPVQQDVESSNRSKPIQAVGTISQASTAGPTERFQKSSEEEQFNIDTIETDSDAFASSEEPSHPLRRIPRAYEDIPFSDKDLNNSDDLDALPTRNMVPPQSRIRKVILTLRDTLQTTFNSLGLGRLYPRRPSFEPDRFVPSLLLSTTCPTVAEICSPDVFPPPYPFPNMTIYRLMSWMNSDSNKKSEAEVARLVKEVMLAEDFDSKHLQDFSVWKSLRELDNNPSGKKIEFPDDWTWTSVMIKIPTKSKDDARPFTVPGLHFRPLVEVIRSAFADIQANTFHLSPFKRLWNDPLDNHKERIFNKLYTSDSWLDAQDEVQMLPKEPGYATHLANFGTAKAWPLYMYFGNLMKYAHSAPKSGACHLVGFLPLLPDKIKDILNNFTRISKSGTAALYTHCRRELFHTCWNILLDQEFLYAYRHGIVLKCADGVMRRIFPRIFTYSADYPEKALIAMIKDMGLCPCPCCLIPKNIFSSLGLVKDMKNRIKDLRVYVETNVVKAREYIYKWGNTVDSVKVEETLGEGSWVPVLNKFVERLGVLGLDPFRMLVVDFMHECELGTWKALFTHLIRILYSLPRGDWLVATLDSRFRLVPTFGNGVIRTFTNNTSEMKRLAARDFEDILQVLAPYLTIFYFAYWPLSSSLLYRFAQWHALAKLRIHSESTLDFLEETFKKLSRQLQKFRDCTCTAFSMVELLKEKAARQ